MKAGKTLLSMLLVAFSFHSCNNEDIINPSNPTQKAVTFTPTIGGENFTRASGTLWDANDQIGVYMKTTGQQLDDTSILDNAGNILYTTPDKTVFQAAQEAQAIHYPADGTVVDFIAYYPYRQDILNYIYKVDVSNQSSQQSLDLLYSDNTTGQKNSAHSSNMVFSHQLSTIILTIQAGEGVTNLSGLEVNISNVYTEADFDLRNGTLTATNNPDNTVNFKITHSGTTSTAQAILIPSDDAAGKKLTFKLASGKIFHHTLAADFKLEKNTRYTYSVKLEDKGPDINPTGYVELPKMSNLPNHMKYILHMLPAREGRNYSMLYDTQQRMAYWVAYPLVPGYHIGSSGRSDNWAYDPVISEGAQPDLFSGFPGWGSTHNYDRGHQLPSGDRTYNYDENSTTFYFSNMTAQENKLNTGMWQALEGKIRTWAGQCDTMYVVTGAMIQTKTDLTIDYVHCNSNRQIAKPKYYFKALAKRTGNTFTTIAYKMDNQIPVQGDKYDNHRLTVTKLEEETGFEFFPQLPESIKNNIDATKWK